MGAGLLVGVIFLWLNFPVYAYNSYANSTRKELAANTSEIQKIETKGEVFVSLLPPGDGVTRYWGVIVGISEYSHISDLQFCDDDARGIYDTLILNPNWDASHIQLLIDEAATKAGIYSAINNTLVGGFDQDDIFLFFFSGHGTNGPDQEPLDETDELDEYLCPYDMTNLLSSGIRDDELEDWLDKGITGTVILDTCYSGGFIESDNLFSGDNLFSKSIVIPGASEGKIVKGDGFVKDLQNINNLVTLTACDDDELSTENSELEHGVFTYFLLESLQSISTDINLNNRISAEEAFNETSPKVTDYSHKQQPQISDNYPGELDLVYAAPPSNVTDFFIYQDINEGAIALHWTDPQDFDPEAILILRNTTENFTPPSNQTTYPDNLGPGGSWCKNISREVQTFTDSGLDINNTYYYRAYCYDEEFNYSSGISSTPAGIKPKSGSAPVIIHTPITSATYAQTLLVTATVNSQFELSQVTTYYRQGGKEAYLSCEMNSGSAYQATIASTYITERGTEYYLETKDINGNTSRSPEVGTDTSFYTVRVKILNLSFLTQSKNWKMFSVPAQLNNPSPSSFLEDDLGRQEDSIWKVYRWDTEANDYSKYPDIPDIAPGTAFWIITKDSKNIDTGEIKSTDTSSDYLIPLSYSVTLNQGWNQVGCPFAFPVNLSEIKVKKGAEIISLEEANDNWVRNVIWWYTEDSSDYDHTKISLEPWEGYWIKALTEGCQLLVLPCAVGEDFETLTRDKNNYFQIKATVENLKDRYNFIGLSDKAKNDYDPEDIEEAPPISPYIHLFFSHPDWGKNSGSYTQDIRKRPVGNSSSWPERIIWETQIKTDQLNKTITLEWENSQTFPDEYNLYLSDENEKILADMKEQDSYSFITSNGKDNFKVIARIKEMSNSPEDLTLSQVYNYPNPTDDATTIHLKLGAKANVTVRIYTISGELIWSEQQNYDAQGTYEIPWDLTNNQGQKLASGIYVLWVKASNSAKTLTKTNKIALIR